MPLPHIQNIEAGYNRYDPMMGSIFQVQFSVPNAVFGKLSDSNAMVNLLGEQVTDISGLDAINKTTAAGSQKFLGVDVSFLNPTLDSTYCEFTVNLNLNLRNTTDAYVLRVFKLWSKLNYDMQSGARTLKTDYVCDFLNIYEANRNGYIWRKISFWDVLLVGVTGLDTLDYTATEARKLQCVFRSDYWDEELSTGLDGTEITLSPENIGEGSNTQPYYEGDYYGRKATSRNDGNGASGRS